MTKKILWLDSRQTLEAKPNIPYKLSSFLAGTQGSRGSVYTVKTDARNNAFHPQTQVRAFGPLTGGDTAIAGLVGVSSGLPRPHSSLNLLVGRPCMVKVRTPLKP